MKLTGFFVGVGLLARGIGGYARSPRLLALGLVPALISAVIFSAAFGVLLYFVSDIVGWLTGFVDGWPEGLRDVVELGATLAVLGLGGLLTVLTFTAVTLLVGDPFYEKISERVERRYGGAPGAVDLPWHSSWRRSAADSVRLLLTSLAFGVPLFLCGFIPVVGQTVVPVAGALVGGWFLALELVGVAFARRGLRLADRRAALRRHRPMALGFGVAVFACFLIPLGAVLVMPAAVAGGTLLARRVLGQPIA
ncbi:MAG TPA: EI24 domain-containing protein [Micromonosporaceae bacterium]|nr:EI24 domain-containing protein [Micromonosporaceae bacterium]